MNPYYGPRIMSFEATLKVLDGVPTLLVTAQIEPDESTPAKRPGPSQLTLRANKRLVKRSAYQFDRKTGLLRMALDARSLRDLSRPEPLMFQASEPDDLGCTLELEVRDSKGREASKEIRLPRPEGFVRKLLGSEISEAFPERALLAGPLGAPGQSAAPVGLRVVKHLMPQPLPGEIGEAELIKVSDGMLEAALLAEGPPRRLSIPTDGSPVTAHPGESKPPLTRAVGPNGEVLTVADEWAAKGDTNIPFLLGKLVSDTGKPRGSAWLLDPLGADYAYVDDVRPVLVRGRALAVVSVSRGASPAVATRIFDLADLSGKPMLELPEPRERSSIWFWGAIVDQDRLYIGRGNGGITVLALGASP